MTIEEETHRRLWNLGTRFVRNRFSSGLSYEDAQDVVSETLDEELLGMADKEQQRQYFLGRLYNKSVDALRRKTAPKRGGGQVKSVEELTEKGWPGPAVTQTVESDEVLEGLRDCIGRLKPQPQQVMHLFTSGVRQADIAAELGVTRARISQVFSQSVHLLRECLEDKGIQCPELT